RRSRLAMLIASSLKLGDSNALGSDAANRPHHVLDDIRASERSSQLGRHAQPRDRENLIEPLEKAAGDARCNFHQCQRMFDALPVDPSVWTNSPSASTGGF